MRKIRSEIERQKGKVRERKEIELKGERGKGRDEYRLGWRHGV